MHDQVELIDELFNLRGNRIMSEVLEMKEHLYHELEVAVRTTKALLAKVKQEDWNYRPHENMRTLLELVHHLVLVPITDLAILQEKSQEDVHQFYISLEGTYDPEQLGNRLEEGVQALKNYLNGLTDEEFLNKETKAFYLDNGKKQAAWLTEIVTHAFHHRAQFFTYLKQLGYDVNMFDLY